MDKVIGCLSFRDRLEDFLADEVPRDARQALQLHVDACRHCLAVYEFEAGMRRALAARLTRVPAPPGLETRIRSALDGLVPGRSQRAWYRGPRFAALAASVLLAALVLGGHGRLWSDLGRGGSVQVTGQHVTLVDGDCDRAGRTLIEQRKCRNHQHRNVLKLANGNYWSVRLDHDAGTQILFAPDMRGRRFVVEGELYPGIRTLRLTDYRPAGGAERLAPDEV